MDTQRWLDIEGFENRYQVSDHGNVRSLDRVQWSEARQCTYTYCGRVLKPQMDGDGYPHVMLGVGKCHKVHLLVARAFIPNPDNLPQVDHEDTDKLNCKAGNLRWCTLAQNGRYRHDTTIRAFERRFSNETKAKVRAEIEAGRPILHIAKEFSMSRSHVRRCAGGK
jgi:hypothetical protein